MKVLQGKVAIVTGASSGIGEASARLFAREGARIVAVARGEEGLHRLVSAIVDEGGEAITVAGDVRDESCAQAAVQAALEHFGGLDIAFNNAGTLGEMGPTPGVSAQGWRDTLDINLTSAFLAAKHQLPAMQARGGGSLIFTSTFVGHTVGLPGAAAYAASKAGLLGLTRALAAEFGAEGIRVNALLPGGTDTPMARAMNGTLNPGPSSRTCTRSSAPPRRRNRRVRRCTWPPTLPPSPPAPRCWSMAVFRSRACSRALSPPRPSPPTAPEWRRGIGSTAARSGRHEGISWARPCARKPKPR